MLLVRVWQTPSKLQLHVGPPIKCSHASDATSNFDAIAVDSVIIDDHVAEIDANPEMHAPGDIDGLVAVYHRLLDR